MGNHEVAPPRKSPQDLEATQGLIAARAGRSQPSHGAAPVNLETFSHELSVPNLFTNCVPNLIPNYVPNLASSFVPNLARNLVPQLLSNVVPNQAPNLAQKFVPNMVRNQVFCKTKESVLLKRALEALF